MHTKVNDPELLDHKPTSQRETDKTTQMDTQDQEPDYTPKTLYGQVIAQKEEVDDEAVKRADRRILTAREQNEDRSYHRDLRKKTGVEGKPPSKKRPYVSVKRAVQEPRRFYELYDLAVSELGGPARPYVMKVHDEKYVVFTDMDGNVPDYWT